MDPQTKPTLDQSKVLQWIKNVIMFKARPKTQMLFYGVGMLYVSLVLVGFAGILVPIYSQLKHTSGYVTKRELATFFKYTMELSSLLGIFLFLCARNTFRNRKLLMDGAGGTQMSSGELTLLRLNRRRLTFTRLFGIVFVIALCSICSVAAYRAGLGESERRQEGTYLMTLFAITDLRGGKMNDGIRNVEKVCFANADRIYAKRSNRKAFAFDLIGISTDDLIKYRAKYCTNHADWTPAEERLDKRMASLHRP